jgi:hypothetical protein
LAAFSDCGQLGGVQTPIHQQPSNLIDRLALSVRRGFYTIAKHGAAMCANGMLTD